MEKKTVASDERESSSADVQRQANNTPDRQTREFRRAPSLSYFLWILNT
jgi:hypothetical protein